MHWLHLLLSLIVAERDARVPSSRSDPPSVGLLVRSMRSLPSSETLELFLAPDGCLDVVIALVINETVTSIFLREALEGTSFMLTDTRLEVAGYTDVEHTREARHDVHGIEVLAHFG